tara:strand:- start:53 stop:721 length:669 start_codon:yes stop_codon:yes gene_type:complete
MSYLQTQRFQILPPVVKNLLIINGLFFLATICLKSMGVNLYDIFGLHHWESSKFKIWQTISHMFMHSDQDFGHIFFNMFAVWMFGSQLENLWGSKRFLNYYLLTGLGAALLQIIIVQFFEIPATLNSVFFIENYTMVGASGCLFGLLIAFGLLFPNTQLFFIFIPFPIKAKYFVMIYGLIELFSGVQNVVGNTGGNIAHWAHLGGMIFGFLIIKYWEKTNKY